MKNNKPAGSGKSPREKEKIMEIEKGMKFRSNKNEREIEILKVEDHTITYMDLKYGTIFAVGRKTFEHYYIQRIS